MMIEGSVRTNCDAVAALDATLFPALSQGWEALHSTHGYNKTGAVRRAQAAEIALPLIDSK